MNYLTPAALLFMASLTQAGAKTLVDFFQPIETGKMVAEGIWGNDPVQPRNITNGLEDSSMIWTSDLKKGNR